MSMSLPNFFPTTSRNTLSTKRSASVHVISGINAKSSFDSDFTLKKSESVASISLMSPLLKSEPITTITDLLSFIKLIGASKVNSVYLP